MYQLYAYFLQCNACVGEPEIWPYFDNLSITQMDKLTSYMNSLAWVMTGLNVQKYTWVTLNDDWLIMSDGIYYWYSWVMQP